jgi:hypothetical protein
LQRNSKKKVKIESLDEVENSTRLKLQNKKDNQIENSDTKAKKVAGYPIHKITIPRSLLLYGNYYNKKGTSCTSMNFIQTALYLLILRHSK